MIEMSRNTKRAIIALAILCALSLPAQTAGKETNITLGQSLVTLNGPWRFHIGDNPRWADPSFDDSQWETVDLTPKAGAFDPLGGIPGYVPGWTAKGHPGYWGYAWYRIRVRVAAKGGDKLALAGPPDVDDGYQVFANGSLLGSFGRFSGGGRPVIYQAQPAMFKLPNAVAADGATTQLLAFRLWMDPSTLGYTPDAGGFHTAPLLGEASTMKARYQIAWMDLFRAYALAPVMAVLFALLALLAGSLILFDRSDTVYRWLAVVFLLTALVSANVTTTAGTQLYSSTTSTLLQDVFLRPLIIGIWVMTWWVWFRLLRPAWIPRALFTLTVLLSVSNLLGTHIYDTVISQPVGTAFHIVSLCIRLLLAVMLVLIVYWGISRQGREGWLALPAVMLVGIAQFQNELGVLHIRTVWFPFGVQLSLGAIAIVALAIAMFILLLRRLMLSLRRQREMALDVKQAQAVQQVLLPEPLTSVPGLAIESEYRPAREVGGDFFQIIPHPKDDSVLIVVGDVTGKGLQAGMLVALIVGAIRSVAQFNSDPLIVLDALNQRLCGRGNAHATCLVLRIDSDGRVTLANAGHLPPYLNGKELLMEGALPLGMAAAAEFPVAHFHLAAGDTLMLMSDGIAEAQDEQGRLFGFDRVNDLLRKPITAADLATAAQKFGQTDDILVLRITRNTQPAQAHGTALELQPAI